MTTTVAASPRLGYGQWRKAISGGGGGHWVATLPRGSAKYLLSMDQRQLGIVIGGAKAFLHFPIAHLSPVTSTFYTGYGRTSFGQPVSLTAHPTFNPKNYLNSGNDILKNPDGVTVTSGCATCMVTCYAGGTTLGRSTYTWASSERFRLRRGPQIRSTSVAGHGQAVLHRGDLASAAGQRVLPDGFAICVLR